MVQDRLGVRHLTLSRGFPGYDMGAGGSWKGGNAEVIFDASWWTGERLAGVLVLVLTGAILLVNYWKDPPEE